MADFKTQFVFGKAANTDQRTNPAGKEQGDHHRTLHEVRVPDGPAVDAAIQAADAINARVEAAGRAQFDRWREQGILDDILKGASLLMGEDVSDAEFCGILERAYSND